MIAHDLQSAVSLAQLALSVLSFFVFVAIGIAAIPSERIVAIKSRFAKRGIRRRTVPKHRFLGAFGSHPQRTVKVVQRLGKKSGETLTLLEIPVSSEREAEFHSRLIGYYRRSISHYYKKDKAILSAFSHGYWLVLTCGAVETTKVCVRDADFEAMCDALIADYLAPLKKGWVEPFEHFKGIEEDTDDDDSFDLF